MTPFAFALRCTFDLSRSFVHSGLFRFSRHPNFFSEMTLWWIVYAVSVAATDFQVWVNWSMLGAGILSLLFQGR